MSRAIIAMVIGLLAVELAIAILLAIAAYGSYLEGVRWSEATFSEKYQTRIALEYGTAALSLLLALIVAAVAVIGGAKVVWQKVSGWPEWVLPCALLAGSVILFLSIPWVTPAGSPHGDVGRGLGQMIVAILSLAGAGSAFFLNWLLRLLTRGEALNELK